MSAISSPHMTRKDQHAARQHSERGRYDGCARRLEARARALLLCALLSLLYGSISAFALPSGGATALVDAPASKEQEKELLKNVLSRPEFNPKPQGENVFKQIWNKIKEWWNDLFGGVSFGSGQGSWFSFIAMIVVFTLAALVIAYAIWKLVLLLEGRRGKRKSEKKEARIVLGERLEPDQKASDLLAEAEALARKGELRAAIRKAYIALLCELGDRKVLTLAQHKTNRDYLRAVRERRPLLNEMQKLTSSFENHWYGFRPATADDWTSFLTSYQRTLKAVTSDK